MYYAAFSYKDIYLKPLVKFIYSYLLSNYYTFIVLASGTTAVKKKMPLSLQGLYFHGVKKTLKNKRQIYVR